MTFVEVEELVKECRRAALVASGQPHVVHDLMRKLGSTLPSDRAAAAQLQPQHTDTYHRRPAIHHADLPALASRLCPEVTTADVRLLLVALFDADTDGTGSILVDELLEMLLSTDGEDMDGMDDGASALSVSADRLGGGAEETEAAAHRRASMYGDARRLSAHHEAAVREAAREAPPSAKEDLRKAVELHREQETRLKAATRAAQVSLRGQCWSAFVRERERRGYRLSGGQQRQSAMTTVG